VSLEAIARFSLQRPLYVAFLALLCLGSGLWGFEKIGRLENPQFPIKNAYVITPYLGASAMEVELEVTDRIESALQELPYLEKITSRSVPGRSEVLVEVIETYDDGDLPQIWDELRRRVGEAARLLPPGAGVPLVEDDFGDVYGILYAIRSADYPPEFLRRTARTLSSAIKQIPGVAKVALNALPEEAVYLELGQEGLLSLGIPPDSLFDTIRREALVSDAGSALVDGVRLNLAADRVFHLEEQLEGLRFGRPGDTTFLRLDELGRVRRAPLEQPFELVRHNGEEVFILGVSVTQGKNVVTVGKAVETRLQEMLSILPVGIEAFPIYEQHKVVEEAVNAFMVNLAISIATVTGALCLFMGWRSGSVVGAVLLLTIMGTLGLMNAFSLELQRISLGALMIAMGMLVDNAIVVAEGMVAGIEEGKIPEEAAAAAVSRTAFPLLGATVIGLLAFAPIGLTDGDTGQFLNSLFWTVAFALMLSWLLAVTVVPSLGARLLKGLGTAQVRPFLLKGSYQKLIAVALRRRFSATGLVLLLSLSSIYAFSWVEQSFFPRTNSPLFHVDFLLPEGSDIRFTAERVEEVEAQILALPEVTAVTSYIGRGANRYTATQRPEQPNPALAQLIIRVGVLEDMDAAIAQVRALLPRLRPEAQSLIYRLEFSPGGSSKIEARFQGPNPEVLRELGEAALAIYRREGLTDLKLDWRQREFEIRADYDGGRAPALGVRNADLRAATAFATTGITLGIFREGEDSLPIVAIAPEEERRRLSDFNDRMVWSREGGRYVPLLDLLAGVELVAEDNQIRRRNRVRTLTAQANAAPGQNLETTFAAVRPEIEALPLPAGYALEWGGEYESSSEAREKLGATIPPAFGLMFLITVLLFGTLRQPLVIWLTVPMVIGGVALSLLLVSMPFTFPASLGLLSLAGMLIKNCIVLVDEIDKRIGERGPTIASVSSACGSRLRPVLLASGTTIAGMAPLLADEFFAEMAMAIMGGLAFTTLLTLLAVPIFYAVSLGRQLTFEKV